MITGITIWIIGWMFTVGVSDATEHSAAQTVRCAIGGILAWPFMLGIMITELLEQQ